MNFHDQWRIEENWSAKNPLRRNHLEYSSILKIILHFVQLLSQ